MGAGVYENSVLSIQFSKKPETALKEKLSLTELGSRRGILREDKVYISDKGDNGKQTLKTGWNGPGKKQREAQPWETVRACWKTHFQTRILPTGFIH